MSDKPLCTADPKTLSLVNSYSPLELLKCVNKYEERAEKLYDKHDKKYFNARNKLRDYFIAYYVSKLYQIWYINFTAELGLVGQEIWQEIYNGDKCEEYSWIFDGRGRGEGYNLAIDDLRTVANFNGICGTKIPDLTRFGITKEKRDKEYKELLKKYFHDEK